MRNIKREVSFEVQSEPRFFAFIYAEEGASFFKYYVGTGEKAVDPVEMPVQKLRELNTAMISLQRHIMIVIEANREVDRTKTELGFK